MLYGPEDIKSSGWPLWSKRPEDIIPMVVEGGARGDRAYDIYSLRGVISAGLAIYDTMNLIRPNVSTICVGLAASMGTVLLCAGAKGKRFALPNSTVHMHQPLGGAQGQASDIEIHAREILRLQDKIRTILSEHTGQSYEKVAQDTDRDFFLNAEQAQEYGLVDEVLMTPTNVN